MYERCLQTAVPFKRLKNWLENIVECWPWGMGATKICGHVVTLSVYHPDVISHTEACLHVCRFYFRSSWIKTSADNMVKIQHATLKHILVRFKTSLTQDPCSCGSQQGPHISSSNAGDPRPLGLAWECKKLADLHQIVCFLAKISSTNLRPDLIVWSFSLLLVCIIELKALGRLHRWGQAEQEVTKGAEQHGWRSNQ